MLALMLEDKRNEEHALAAGRIAPVYDFVFEALWEVAG